jgi:hypothetical protein
MTSPDGITWTSRSAAADNRWYSVTYGNGLFVAVSYDRTNRVMTSPDGINWTSRTAASDDEWLFVTYGNGLFVAVSWTGTNRVMTSPDGINWTSRTAASDDEWLFVTYGNGLFVAVTTNRVMTSGEIELTADTGAAAAAKAKADADAAASAESARKQKVQQELTEIMAIIPIIGDLTLSLGELTKAIVTKKSVVSGLAKSIQSKFPLLNLNKFKN